ncbi:MAG: molybdopterin-guanine dinucleotide biosynthesis protein B [Rhodobacteraceae bacterium]|nr:molybdopterin-guanine dinucleotide biosynthesis protein B [Paracoccaceae bacterium]
MKKQQVNKNSCVIGICASNSGCGKTTLIEKLVPKLIQKGFIVSVIKHAHHKFDIDIPGKDSFRLRKAGAYQTLVFNDVRSAVITENINNEVSLEKEIKKINLNADIILIEGLKNMAYPKIEIYRNNISDEKLYENDSNIIAIASDIILDEKIPCFNLNDINGIVDFIIENKHKYEFKYDND